MTIQSVEVVDPSQDNKPSGTNRVVSIKDEDLTGEMKLFSLPSTMDKANLLIQAQSGRVGRVM
jgi:hypothetical protein